MPDRRRRLARVPCAVLAGLWLAACGNEPPGMAADAGPGEGTIVATLPVGVIALAIAEDASRLEVLGGIAFPDGGVAIGVYGIEDGRAVPESIDPTVRWEDYFVVPEYVRPLGFTVVSRTAFLRGFEGITVVPLDGSPWRWLYRPFLGEDGGVVLGEDGGVKRGFYGFPLTEGPDPVDFAVEPDGSVLIVGEGRDSSAGIACHLGRYSLSGDWTEVLSLGDECTFGSHLLATPDHLDVTTNFHFWRVDRATLDAGILVRDFPGTSAYGELLTAVGDRTALVTIDPAGESLVEVTPAGVVHEVARFTWNQDPATGIAVEGEDLDLLSLFQLRRLHPDGGMEVLARVSSGGFGVPGDLSRLVVTDGGVYALHLVSTDAGIVSTVRSVPRSTRH